MAIYQINGEDVEVENGLDEKIARWDCKSFDALVESVEDWEIEYIDCYLNVSPIVADAVTYWQEKSFKSVKHAKVYEFTRQEFLSLLDEIECTEDSYLLGWFCSLCAMTKEVFNG